MRDEGENELLIRGNIGTEIEDRKDPESGSITCSFRVATNNSPKTEWHHVRAWGVNAQRCILNLRVGSRIWVKGPLITEKSGRGSKRVLLMVQMQILKR